MSGAVGTVAGLCLGLTLASGTAVAAFSDSEQSSAQYSTATLLAPAEHPTNITMTCLAAARTITVKTFGQVEKANYHELKIFVDSNPVPIYVGELKKQGQTVLPIALGTGTWRAEITGQYRPAGTSNVWTSPALVVPLVCR
jgi:predicted ribosomally synthesized peptide with SipW-like signal peptide